jgi:YaiO family outer membrane protein
MRHAALVCLLAFVVLAGMPAPASPEQPTGTDISRSEPPPPGPGWEGRLLYDLQTFDEGRDDWHTYGIAIYRRLPRASIGLEVLRAHRFDEQDEAIALDATVRLWRMAYGNVRFQGVIDADVLPRTDAMVELYQGVGAGWEASVGYRNLDVPESMVHVATAGIAKYIGDDWYLRQRTTFSVTEGDLDVFFSGAVRRYLAVPDDWIQLDAGIGREVIDVAAGPTVESRTVQTIGVRFQKFFIPRLGIAIAGSYRDERGGPSSLGTSIQLMTRW